MHQDKLIKLLLLAFAALVIWHVASSPRAPLASPSPMHIITVAGQAERKVVPDEGHVVVNLNSMRLKLAEAKKEHDDKLRRLLEIAKENGVEEKLVSTQSSNVQPVYRYTYENNTQQRFFEGYRVQTMLDMTVKKMEAMGTIMEKISEAGFEKGASTEWGQLMTMHYAVGDPEKIRDEMLAEAVASARKKAEQMADAAGGSLGKVTSISEGSVPQIMPYPVPMMAMAKGAGMAMAESAPAVTPPAGEQSLNAQVSVSFELK